MQAQYRGMNLIIPDNDTEWNGYFEAAREHRLALKMCGHCHLLRYPPGAACPWCTSLEWSWQDVSGKGTIHSYEIVMQAIQAGFRDWAPYAVVLVELDEQRGQPTADEGLRLISNLVTDDFKAEKEENVAIGKRVEVTFLDVSPDLSLPLFKLSQEPPQGPVWQLK